MGVGDGVGEEVGEGDGVGEGVGDGVDGDVGDGVGEGVRVGDELCDEVGEGLGDRDEVTVVAVEQEEWQVIPKTDLRVELPVIVWGVPYRTRYDTWSE